jgi:ABC-type glycerol-3-phosphate transport system permease component
VARRTEWTEPVKYALLVFLALLTFGPLLFTLMTSFKDNEQFDYHFWTPTLPLHAGNYLLAWDQIRRYMLNSVVVTASSIALTVAVSACAAYAFGRGRFPGRGLLFYAVIGLMMFPGVLLLIPTFRLVQQMGMLNTLWVLILPYAAHQQIISIFIMRSFFATMPEELFEAARMDGASEVQNFRLIALPLALPILGAIATITLISSWNDYIWPLLTITEASLRTITLGLTFFAVGEFQTAYGPLMAGYVIAALPLIVLFSLFMRMFIDGMTAGAVKM